MNVFAVIATSPEAVEPLRLAVEAQFLGNFIKAGSTLWFVADGTISTPVEICQKLGVKGSTPTGTLVNAVVIWIVTYWGSASPEVWSWIASKLAQK
jgi:hypothetical protein